ncbi:MAG: hypothetical protein JW709_00250 [Sedimentisphaerales bacterium]|nr:hypothetical protein [Sedimentisphaerales bacterium]
MKNLITISLSIAFIVFMAVGCNSTPIITASPDAAVNSSDTPETNAMIESPEPAVSTAAMPEKPEYKMDFPTRDWPETICTYQPVGIPHPTLYVQDPFFEGNVSDNGRFQTFTGEDLLAAAAGPFIFLGQIIAAPVEAVITPPWQTQCARSGYDHADEPTHALSWQPSGMTVDDDMSVETCCKNND